MTKQEITGYRDRKPLEIQRALGRQLYTIDIDSLGFTFKDGKAVPSEIMDYKHDASKALIENASNELQRTVADMLKIPFFVVISYLDKVTPCYFLLAQNDRAVSALRKFNPAFVDRGWLSMKDMSKIKHQMRDLPFPSEMDHLSDKIETYRLPAIHI